MSERTGLEIAVTGLAGRFPGAPTVEDFWSRLERGQDCVAHLSDEDLAEAGLEPSEFANPARVKKFGRLDGIDRFDARLFGLSPRESELMDPQHRLLLECAWEALERAAYDPDQLPSLPIGVFVGCGNNSYFLKNVLANADFVESVGGLTTGFGHAKDHLAPLLAFKLGLEGPSVTVQSACSTALLAVHLACQSLLSGECDIALAGAVSVDVSQNEGYLADGGGLLSRRGRCRAFDAGTDGMVPGNGAGIVVLRRLEEALESSDAILAILKGSAVGNDGSRRAGYGAPRSDSQARVIRAAQLMAEVEASSLQYVEAHGSGTLLGDSVEVGALTKAFRATTDHRGFCALGSVKGNVGHVGAASGIAGLIKTVLAIGRRTIPPTLHFETPNPQIDFDSSPFYVGTELAEWKRNGSPRRAGVSSFGMGGTNVHVIVEEAPELKPSRPGRLVELLVWSAATPSALETLTDRLRQRLLAAPDDELADIAHTLSVGRRRLAHRRMLLCGDRAEALAALERRDHAESVGETGARSVAFVFPDLGDHFLGMGRELAASEPVFREAIDRCAELARSRLGLDLGAVLHPKEIPGECDFDDELAGPALFAVEYALAQFWVSWGVRPDVSVGSGIGRISAACVAGALTLEKALAAAAGRSRVDHDLLAPFQESAGELEKAGHLRLTLGPRQGAELPSLAAASGGRGSEIATVLESLGRLWLCGVDISWVDFYAGQDRRKVVLPTYPFERERHWLERPRTVSVARVEAGGEASARRCTHQRPLDEATYVEPANEIERELAGIFQELLGLDRVGARDSFFKLGGNSILGLQVISRVRRIWDVELPLAELFETPTVAALAHGITTSLEQGTERSEPGLLENLDNLSDDDVDAMLAELMAEGG